MAAISLPSPPRALVRLARSWPVKLALVVGFFTLAAWAIRRDFAGVSLVQVAGAFAFTPPPAVIAAAAALAASFLCLGVTEWFVLRYIGQGVAPLRAMGVAFVCYAFSNSIGFGPATVSTVRLRFYKADGLSPKRIAAVTLLAAAAVTISGVVCAGVGLLVSPQLSWQLRVLGACLTLPSALWLWDFGGKRPRVAGIRLRAPKALAARTAFLGAGVGDWVLSGGALFLLLPNAPLSQFPAFLAVFVAGSVVGSASGVPGGLGVFEAVVLGLRGATGQVHETAAALIIYRLINAVAPLAIASGGLAVRRLLTHR